MDNPSSDSEGHQSESSSDQENWTVQKILNWTTSYLHQQGYDSPRLESEVLLAHARGCQRIELYTDFNKTVNQPTRTKMRELVQRRATGEPVAYLVGYREFFSLDFEVEPGIFIPRPETETLVLEALSRLENVSAPEILELCTGSGCISVSLATQKPQSRLTAVDLNPLACHVAARNCQKHAVEDTVQILNGNLLEALSSADTSEKKEYDLLISNPPYVCSREIAELDRDIQNFEPHLALDGGADGLDVIRKIIEQGASHLKPEGWCLLEMDPAQIEPCLQLVETSGFWKNSESIKDASNKQRVVVMQKR